MPSLPCHHCHAITAMASAPYPPEAPAANRPSQRELVPRHDPLLNISRQLAGPRCRPCSSTAASPYRAEAGRDVGQQRVVI